MAMDSAELDSGATLSVALPQSHTGVRSESVTEQVVGNGAGALVLPSQAGLGELAPALDRRYEHGQSLTARAAKRAFDLVGAILLLVVLAPFWITMALLIKLDSPGPILFRQRRIGRDGTPFSMLKFRTMVDGADAHKPSLLHLNEAGAGLFKINGDPRVTRVGQWLRATSMDELPQLLHVVTGQMSLVGPRPLVPEEDAQITGFDRRRLAMRPGMTGAWQAGGDRSISILQMADIDNDYVQHWSIWTDVRLLFETAAHVALRKGL
jgi:lipopolysaccharide/colanic/teichoic acid biosynthesis glycosyltransferase